MVRHPSLSQRSGDVFRKSIKLFSLIVILSILIPALSPSPALGESPTDTPTPTPTEVVENPEPSEPAPPENTPTAILELTDTPPSTDPYPPPGEEAPWTPEVTETLALTETPPAQTEEAPTATPVLAQVMPSLKLSIDDAAATPGGRLGIWWEISGVEGKDPANAAGSASGTLSILLRVPAGFELVDGEKGTYAPLQAAYVFPVDMAADTAGSWAQFRIPERLAGPYLVQAELLETQEGEAAIQLAAEQKQVEESGLTRLGAEGGEATGLGGRVKLIVPAGAAALAEPGEDGVTEPQGLEVRIRQPVEASQPKTSLSGMPFEIVIHEAQSGEKIEQFASPLTLEVAFSGDRDQSLFYYEPLTSEWIGIPGEVDYEQGVIRARIDHLTVFDQSLDEWQMAAFAKNSES
jgi:hypothetical protein